MPPHKSSNIKPSIEEALTPAFEPGQAFVGGHSHTVNNPNTIEPSIEETFEEPGQAFIDKAGAVRPEPASNAYDMGFGDAIRCLKRGQRVQRAKWGGHVRRYIMLGYVDFGEGRVPCFFDVVDDVQGHVWAVRQLDMLADDWRVVA